MISIVMLGVASLMDGTLMLTRNLPTGVIAKVSPTQFTNNLEKAQAEFFSIGKAYKRIWSKNLVLTNLFPFNGKSRELASAVNTVNSSISTTLTAKETELCAYVPENIAAQSQLQNATHSLPAPVSQISFPKINISPANVVRSLESFFKAINNPLEQNSSHDYAPVLIVRRNYYNYEVWVNNSFIARLPDEITANFLKDRLQQLVSSPTIQPTQLQPGLVDNTPSLMVGNRLLFAINRQLSNQLGSNGHTLAIQWINNLRIALHAEPLTLVQGQIEIYGLQSSSTKLSGLASWYGGYFHGRLTANGEIYNQDDFTVAHRSLPFNTYLKVTNTKNGKSVIVRVNDRGPYISPRSLDLSRTAARCLGSEHTGVVPYQAVVLQQNAPQMTLNPSPAKTQEMANAKSELLVSKF
ncbi:MAG: septal ring lytic transglycosylase RlpA family protein [Cuspidothrix sp.]